MNRIAELILEGDMEASVKVGIRAGPICKTFEADTAVIREKFSLPHSLVCIREKSNPDCYWFAANYLRSAP
jgi:hypothetical protein